MAKHLWVCLLWVGCASSSTGTPPAATVALKGPGETITADSEYLGPAFNGGVPPYASTVSTLRFENTGTAEVMLNSVQLTALAGSDVSEWSVATVTKETKNVKVAGGSSHEFAIRLRPLSSGPRKVKVTLTWDTTQTLAFTHLGQGSQNLTFSPNASPTFERIYGRRTASALAGSMVVDSAGNQYFSANANEWSDPTSPNLVVGRLNADGTLGWAKEWNEPNQQTSPDPGQNAQSGGGADAMALGADGHLYVVGQRSTASSNSTFQALVLKVNKDDGALVWARGLTRGNTPNPDIAAKSARAYAVDATVADRVLVAGQASDNAGMLLFAVEKSTGNLLWARELDVGAGTTERAHALVVDAQNNAYLGGLSNGSGVLAKVSAVDTALPTLTWVFRLPLGTGSNVNSLALDAAGNVYAALDYRGAVTRFAAARFAPDGQVSWVKGWDPNNDIDRNNTHVVRVSGDNVLVGGRISIKPYDRQLADGFVMNLTTAGLWKWGAFYYSGNNDDVISEHRVKGLALVGNDLWVLQQAHPGLENTANYRGAWYQAIDDTLELPGGNGAARLTDVALAPVSELSAAALVPCAVTSLTPNQPATLHVLPMTPWQSPPTDVSVEDAATRQDSHGKTQLLLQRLKITGN